MKSSDLKQKLGLVYAIAAVTVVVIVVVGIIILNGTDDDDDSPAIAQEEGSGGDDGGGDDSGDSGEPPPLRTVAVERGEGKNATVAAASPSLEQPKEIWLRVSAAPKQEVNGSWNVSCGKGNVAMDTFKVTPPHVMKLEVPGDSPDTCIAGSNAQLKKSGRLKLTILRDR
jgi:hypothetical protein